MEKMNSYIMYLLAEGLEFQTKKKEKEKEKKKKNICSQRREKHQHKQQVESAEQERLII